MTIDLDDFPPLTSEEIEQRANALLNEYSSEAGWQIDTPVPVERIAEGYLGYDIELTNEGLFSDPNFLGGIIFEQNLIQVNGSVEEHEGRYNFTIAHELGHHTLHRDELLSRQGTEDDHVIICRESGNKPMVEQQADRFAAALLMPQELVSIAFNSLYRRPVKINQRPPYRARKIASEVIAAGEFTNVSNTAMVNRLIDLGMISGASYQTGTAHDFHRRSTYKQKMLKQGMRMLKQIVKDRMRNTFRR